MTPGAGDFVEDAPARWAAFERLARESVDLASIVERAVELASADLSAPCAAVVRGMGRRFPSLVIVHASAVLGVGVGHQYEVDQNLAEALRGAEPVIITDRIADGRFTHALLPGSPPPTAYLATAIMVDGRTWGRLIAADHRPRRFTADQVLRAAQIAQLLGAAVRRVRWHRARISEATLAARMPVPGQAATEVALVDRAGVIVWVNQAWLDYCRDHGGDPARCGVGVSYLECCDDADDEMADEIAAAIRLAARGDLPAPMRLTIPCHSPTTREFYDMLISSRLDDDGTCRGATITLSRAPGSEPSR